MTAAFGRRTTNTKHSPLFGVSNIEQLDVLECGVCGHFFQFVCLLLGDKNRNPDNWFGRKNGKLKLSCCCCEYKCGTLFGFFFTFLLCTFMFFFNYWFFSVSLFHHTRKMLIWKWEEFLCERWRQQLLYRTEDDGGRGKLRESILICSTLVAMKAVGDDGWYSEWEKS